MRFFLVILAIIAPFLARADSVESYLTRPGSHALLTIELPFPVLQRLLEAEIEDVYRGQTDNPTDGLRDDQLTWEARTRDVKVGAAEGALVMQAAADGEATLTGKFGIVPLSLTADLEVLAEVTMRPIILPDWSIAANSDGRAVISEASLYGLSLRDELQPGLNRSVTRSIERFNRRLADPEFLRGRAEATWRQMCQTATTGGGIAFRPHSVAVTQPVFATQVMRVTLVFSGHATLSGATQTPCPELPETILILD